MTDDPRDHIYEVPDETDAPEPERAPVTARGVMIVGSRIVAGIIGTGIAALAIGAAAVLPLPSQSVTPASRLVTPVSAAQQRVCPGGLLRLGDDTGQGATTVSSVGRPSVQFGQSEGKATSAPLSTTDNSTGLAPQLLGLAAGTAGATIPLLAGSQSQSVDSGDLVGFAAGECSEASSDSWLVGGSTATGRTSILTLSNPTGVEATVTLSIFSEGGEVNAAGTAGIVVAPGAERVLSLAGFAPSVVSPVVHVESRGGQIVAGLQQSTVRTLEPGGVDFVGMAAEPATSTVIPGLVVLNSDATVARQGEPGFADLATVIRVFVPGVTPAKTTIKVVPEAGGTASTTDLTVEPGAVTDVPLDALPDGSYTVSIDSDQPLVAGARVSTTASTGQTDFAWIAGAPDLQRRAIVSIAPGQSPVLHLANPTSKAATVSVRALDGSSAATSVTVQAGAAVAVPVAASVSYSLSGFATLTASLSYAGDGALSVFTVSPSAPASSAIRVYP